MDVKKKLIVILGPTAIGKTALSIGLAQHFHTEIISADSRQFFTELNIGVARPSQEELAAIPHHFIAFTSVNDNYSAGMYERDALQKLNELFLTHDTVICCGGSMLYIDALLYGLDELPADAGVKAQLMSELEQKGKTKLQEKLKALDPEYYTTMDADNPHRLIRALEVCIVSGEKYSALRKSTARPRDFDIVKIGLTADREWLYNRINQRVDRMMEEGLLDEVKRVFPLRELNALNTVGYKELFDHLHGNMSIEAAVDKIKQHTRNFAKRQLSWWKRSEDIEWVAVDDGEDYAERAYSILEGRE